MPCACKISGVASRTFSRANTVVSVSEHQTPALSNGLAAIVTKLQRVEQSAVYTHDHGHDTIPFVSSFCSSMQQLHDKHECWCIFFRERGTMLGTQARTTVRLKLHKVLFAVVAKLRQVIDVFNLNAIDCPEPSAVAGIPKCEI